MAQPDGRGISKRKAGELDARVQFSAQTMAQALPQISDRTQPPYSALNLGAYWSEAYRIFMTSGADASDPILTFANFYVNGQTDTVGPARITVRASIEPTVGATPVLAWAPNGMRDIVLEPGARADLLPVPVELPKGTQFAVRVQVSMTDGWAADVVGTPSTASGTLAAGTYTYRITKVIDGTEKAYGYKTSTGEHWITVALGGTGKISLSWTPDVSATPARTRYKIYRGTTSTNQTLLYTTTADGEVTYEDTGAVTPAGAQPTFTWGTGVQTTIGDGDGKTNGFISTRDYTTGSFSIGPATTNCFGPVAVRGKVLGKPNAIYVCGDSIPFGSNDSGNVDRRGYIYRALSGKVGYINNCKGSTSAQAFATFSNRLYRMSELRGITHAIVAWGTNDLGTRTSAQIIADLNTICNVFLARGIPVFLATILPRPALIPADEVKRVEVNTAIRAKTDVYVMELADLLETSRNSGVPIPGTIDADNVHPTPLGHATLAEATNFIRYRGTTYGWDHFYS